MDRFLPFKVSEELARAIAGRMNQRSRVSRNQFLRLLALQTDWEMTRPLTDDVKHLGS